MEIAVLPLPRTSSRKISDNVQIATLHITTSLPCVWSIHSGARRRGLIPLAQSSRMRGEQSAM